MKKIILKIALLALFIIPVGLALKAQAITPPNWNTTGSYIVTFTLGTDYIHDLTLTQDGLGNITGDGGYPSVGPYTYTWVVTSGSVAGDAIDLYSHYTASADAVTPLTSMHMTGTIAPDGSMSGTWTDNYQGGSREGIWHTTKGTATKIQTQQTTVKVTIDKFIDGKMATSTSANNLAFPMQATWSATNIGSGTGTYAIGSTGFNSPNAYEAITADMTSGASYSTEELTSESVVGTDCTVGKPYALVGYTTGNTLDEAKNTTPSATAPNITNITNDKVIIVWNKICVPTPTHVSPLDNSTLTTLAVDKIDWNDVTDPALPMTYFFEDSNSNATNPDGSFISTIFGSGPLLISEQPTPSTPEGVYYWHVRAVDADGNTSTWSTPWMFTVKNPSNGGGGMSTLKVHILKYLDGEKADATSANEYDFPMIATWKTNNINSGVSTSDNYVLGNNHGGASDLYGADTAPMSAPADYTTSEVTSGDSQVVSSVEACTPGKYVLNGYRTSASGFADAATQPLSSIAPIFTGIISDRYIIVDNSKCQIPEITTGSITVTKNALNGNGTFNFTSDIPGWATFNITTVGHTGGRIFSNLTPGTYHINEETVPSNWTLTSNECSSVEVTADNSTTCTVTNTKVPKLGEIIGTKYEDINGDGKLKNKISHRLSGWTIYLDQNDNGIFDDGEPSSITGSTGDGVGVYHFSGLVAGTYIVREVQKDGWTQTFPSTDSYTIILTPGKIAKNKDFGNFHQGIISGMKYNDISGNGKKDVSDNGLTGWTINLKGPGSFTASTVTDENGNYSFSNLGPGVYKLAEVMQPGWHQTQHPGSVKITSDIVSTDNNFGNKHNIVVTRR